ncbi:inovirus-type Gp2 protein [Acinetobacter baumannii]|uniref:inovirus-type Gp2 protein n=1 Tax=Acinetobacter baumannii TaxID=470 RepID=UPI001580A109|nr:inovirus-type Gp2 protein [Acinetobacter baumannii]NUG32374.1 inovirus-type Gp2 protein [Acinetobacter baumannii]
MINESAILIAIEQLMQKVSSTLDQELKTKRRYAQKLRAYTRQCCDLIPGFKQLRLHEIQLMFPLDRFQGVVDVVDRICLQNNLSYNELPYTDHYRLICIAMHIFPSLWKREQASFREQEMKNRLGLAAYIADIFSKHSYTLWVRVELKYLTESLDILSIVDVAAHLAKLRKRISDKDTCFNGLVGFAWALEQGGETGAYHCHLLLIYNGSKYQWDHDLAEKVGLLWVEITQGYGCYRNLNSYEHRKKHIDNGTDGLGMIKREKNPDKVKNAKILALYLAVPEKFDQRLRAKVYGMKTFGHGQFKLSPYLLRQAAREADENIQLPF